VNDAVNRDVDPNANRQSENRSQGKPRRLAQHSNCEGEVLEKVRDQAKTLAGHEKHYDLENFITRSTFRPLAI
jgi:hypothetical protein